MGARRYARVTVEALESGSTGPPSAVADFSDVDRYPEIAFQFRQLEPEGGRRYGARGDVTIRDITLPLELEPTVEGWRASRGKASSWRSS